MLADATDRGGSPAPLDFLRPVDIMGYSHLLKVVYVYICVHTHNTNLSVEHVTCDSVSDTTFLSCRLQLQCNYIDVCSTV